MNKYVRMVDRIERAEEICRYTENRCDALEQELIKAKEIIKRFVTWGRLKSPRRIL